MPLEKFRNIEGKLILIILSQLPADSKNKVIKDLLDTHKIDWFKFKEFIIYHELVPFVYLALKDFSSVIPTDLIKLFKNNYYYLLCRSQKIWHEFLRILTAFEQKKITLLPLKGTAFLEDTYSGFPIRPMADIDLIVQQENLKEAERILYDLGYIKELSKLKEEYWRKHQCHIAFCNKENRKLPLVELHWSIDFKRQNREIIPEIWERTREINVSGRKIKLLSPEDTLFSLALHIRRFGKPLCLKNVYDLVLLLNKYRDYFDWDYCLSQSKKYNICSTLFFFLLQYQSLGLDLPKYIEKKLNIPVWKRNIINNFIKENTFLPQQNNKIKSLYLKSHFLLYDTFYEPVKYIINIPQEQFAKFYGLKAYDKKTSLLYNFRLWYILLRTIFNYKKIPPRRDDFYLQ